MTELPATGNNDIPWKPAAALIALGALLLATAARKRTLRVTIR